MYVKGKEKALLHLLDLEENYLERGSSSYHHPFVLCQEGIAEMIDLSPKTVSKILTKLEKKGLIKKRSKRIWGCESKRFGYFLTKKGKKKAEEIKKELENNTITILTDEGDSKIRLKNIDRYIKGFGKLNFAINHLNKKDELDLRDIGKKEPFVNRKKEKVFLENIIDIFNQTEGDLSFILLRGYTGVGKTRLIQEMEKHIEREEIGFLKSRCEGDPSDPYAPFKRSISTFFDEKAQKMDIDIEKSDILRGSEEFSDILEGLKTMADEIPLMIFIDDLHRADKVTIESFLEIVDILEEEPICLIGSCRKEEMRDERKELIEEKLDRSSSCVVKDIEPLQKRDVRKLVIQRLDRCGVPDQFIDLCYDISQGVPLFIEAHLDDMLKNGILDPVYAEYPESKEDIEFTDEIIDIYYKRLEKLEETEMKILETCGCLSKEVSFEILLEFTGGEEKDVRSSIKKLQDENILDMDLRGHVSFVRYLTEVSVKSKIKEKRKKEIHMKIANILLKLYENEIEDHYIDLALHHEKAESLEKAREYYIEAGKKAEEAKDHERASELYKKAVNIQNDISGPSLKSSWLFEKMAEMEARSANTKKGIKFLNKAIEEEDDKIEIQRLKRNISERFRDLGEYDRSLECADESLEILNKCDEDDERIEIERCKTLKEKGITFMRKNDFETSEKIFKEIKESSEKIDEKMIQGYAVHYLGSIAYYRSDFDKAKKLLQKALEIRSEIGDHNGLAESFNNLGVIYRARQEYEKALYHYEEANKIKKEIGFKYGFPEALDNIGIIYLDMGELDRSLEYHKKCLKIEKDESDKNGIASCMDNIGVIYLEKGDTEKALQYFNKSLGIKEWLDEKNNIALSHYNIGKVYKMKGELGMALVHLKKSLELRKEIGNKQDMAYSLLWLGQIYIDRLIFEKATEQLNQALELFKKVRDEYGMGMSLDYLGKINLLKGNMKKAKLYLEHSKNIGTNFQDMRYEIVNYRHLAELYHEKKDFQKTKELINQSLNRAHHMGAKDQIGKCRHLRGYMHHNQDHWYLCREEYQEALNFFDKVGNKKEKAKVLFDWAVMLNRIRETEDAENKLKRSLELFRRCGINGWGQTVRGISASDLRDEIQGD